MKLFTVIGMLVYVCGGLYGGEAVKYDEKYFTIGEVKVEKMKDDRVKKGKEVVVPAPDELPKPEGNGGGGIDIGNIGGGGSYQETLNNVNSTIDTLDKIVNLAQKIWEVIEKNQPVVNINVNYANAVPKGIEHWTQLQGWSKPKTQTYSFVVKNGYGAEVVKVKYQLQFRYGGNYQGKGKFLTGVTVEPISVETAWGYKVSLNVEVPDSTIANVGTHEDPVASMQVQLKWTIHTVLKNAQQKVVYYVQGDGEYGEIASPFKKMSEEMKQEVKVEVPRDGGVVEKIKSAEF